MQFFFFSPDDKMLFVRDDAEQAQWQELPVREHVERYMAQGMSEKDAMKQAAKDRGVGKREIYAELKRSE